MIFEMITRNQSRSPSKSWTKTALLRAITELGLEPKYLALMIISIEFPSERRKEVETRLRRVSSNLAYIVRP